MTFLQQGKPRPTGGDYLRALGYLGIMLWAVAFMIFPPTAFVNGLDFATRLFWMMVTFTGSALALLGALLRIDIKMELPGLTFTLVGPLLYFASQIYYVSHPLPNETFSTRAALVIYAILPGILLLPRTFELYAEGRRLKKVVLDTARIKKEIAETGEVFLPGEGIRIRGRAK